MEYLGIVIQDYGMFDEHIQLKGGKAFKRVAGSDQRANREMTLQNYLGVTMCDGI